MVLHAWNLSSANREVLHPPTSVLCLLTLPPQIVVVVYDERLMPDGPDMKAVLNMFEAAWRDVQSILHRTLDRCWTCPACPATVLFSIFFFNWLPQEMRDLIPRVSHPDPVSGVGLSMGDTEPSKLFDQKEAFYRTTYTTPSMDPWFC